jgi:hypothetical protein
LRVHGSASGTAASADHWSDLDLMITAADPAVVAEDFARQIGRRLSPVFAASRSIGRPLPIRGLESLRPSVHTPRC